ncbi:MAG: magnesium transporter CorA family protein [Acidobacteria bacterium]|nr:magnesium transporter CorA family protein [Acidobacteriota bacterium]
MEWYDLRDPNDPQLDELAQRYHLHPLHIEDCRHKGQRAKVEENDGYIFVVLKPVDVAADGELEFSDLDVFLGRDFLISVHEADSASGRRVVEPLRATTGTQRADQIFYRIADGIVDSFLPMLDRMDDLADVLEDEVLEDPSPACLERISHAKRNLIELRRVLTNTRDVAAHLQRTESEIIGRDLWPFLRDIYDHVARNLDTVEMQRDLISGAMDIYLSSQAQRTNQVMKVLTVLSTIALPSLVISSFFGMNLHGLPWSEYPHGSWLAFALMIGSTLLLLLVMRIFRWL